MLLPVKKILKLTMDKIKSNKKHLVLLSQKCNVTKNIAFYREAKTIQKTISEAEINGTFFRSSYSHLPFKEQS